MDSTTYGPEAVHEWVEFEDPGNPGEFFRVNVSFMLSNYHCMYGSCTGIKSNTVGSNADIACCSQGVAFVDDDDIAQVRRSVAMLDDTNWANKAYADAHTEPGKEGWAQNLKGKPYKTRKLNGRCIFSNPTPTKPGDPNQGCAFHVLADQKGMSYLDTKPDTCWKVPLFFDYDETTSGNYRTTITAMSTGEWGGMDSSENGLIYDDATNMPVDAADEDLDLALDKTYLAWWCIDTPDAYSGKDPFYVYSHEELTRTMGKPAYDRLCELLEMWGDRKFKMMGEQVNDGKPTIATIGSLYASLHKRRDARDAAAKAAGAGDGDTSGSTATVGESVGSE